MTELTYLTNDIIRMVSQSLRNIKKNPDLANVALRLPHRTFVDQFKTISINLPRRSGTSTAAGALFNMYPDSVLFYPRHEMRRYHLQELSTLKNIPSESHKDIMVVPRSEHDFNNFKYNFKLMHIDGIRRNRYSLVIFDGTELMNAEALDLVIDTYSPFVDLFVLLG